MVVVPFWEHTQSHNVLFLFLSPYPRQERKPKENKGALRRKIIVSLVLSNIIVMANSGKLQFTFYSMIISMGYCLWLIVRINNRIIFCVLCLNVVSKPLILDSCLSLVNLINLYLEPKIPNYETLNPNFVFGRKTPNWES